MFYYYYYTGPNSDTHIHHIFALTVFEDYLYWTDWETNTVERCNKYSGNDTKTLTKTIHRPMDIHVFHPFRQQPCKSLYIMQYYLY